MIAQSLRPLHTHDNFWLQGDCEDHQTEGNLCYQSARAQLQGTRLNWLPAGCILVIFLLNRKVANITVKYKFLFIVYLFLCRHYKLCYVKSLLHLISVLSETECM